MKINFIIPFIFPTGGIKVIIEYCNRLSDRGNDIVIYTPIISYKFNNKGIKGKFKRVKSSLGNIVKKKRNESIIKSKASIKLIPVIDEKYIRDADIVVATAWPTAYDVDKLSNSKGKKVYLIQHYEIWSGDKKDVDGSYMLNLNRIVIANWIKELLEKNFNKKSKVIYNGISSKEFLNGEKIVDNNSIVCCMMYHKLEWKGFSDGLKAFEIVKKYNPNLKLKLFGLEDGHDIPEYAEFYKNPSRETLKKIYSESNIYIFPSRNEGWGLTILEAMACKCAVVGTNTGALIEIGIDGENCLKSESENIIALANNIKRLIDNDNLLNDIANSGYRTALNFKWENSIDEIEKYFRSLICQGEDK
ncbi:glycosyltransferase [Clostridium perfringens]|uniref:glycosyltransferase n=1 Tax=Clostridium perfringens TaxID=1502 RepID=UPI0018E44CCB|nr:glycosyltransferase family 4 protein [Clostridium perfringens]